MKLQNKKPEMIEEEEEELEEDNTECETQQSWYDLYTDGNGNCFSDADSGL